MEVLTGLNIIDGKGNEPIEDGVVVINSEKGIIEYCGRKDEKEMPELDQSKARTIDLKGKTIIPGLIDAHIHICFEPSADPFAVLAKESNSETALKAAEYARRTLKAGITTVRDMGGKDYVDLALRDSIRKGQHQGPEILAAGNLLTMTGGHGWPVGEEVDGEDEGRKGARKQLKQGADLVKVMATGGVMTKGVEPGSPQLTEEEIRSAVQEAHKAGKKAAAHAQGNTGIKNSIRAGIDSVEHGVYLDAEGVDMMLKSNTYLVPTIAAPYWISTKGREAGMPENIVQKSDMIREEHVKSFQKAYEAGVKIAMGTDAGTPFNQHGNNSYELVLMVENGMSPMDAIIAGTKNSAELLGILNKVGTIETGKKADLLILEKSPLKDINNINEINKIYKQGKEVKLAQS